MSSGVEWCRVVSSGVGVESSQVEVEWMSSGVEWSRRVWSGVEWSRLESGASRLVDASQAYLAYSLSGALKVSSALRQHLHSRCQPSSIESSHFRALMISSHVESSLK